MKWNRASAEAPALERPRFMSESKSKCPSRKEIRTMTNPSYFDRYENLAFSRDDNGV